jgi:DNA-binding XRE family transcriptional regulator
MPLQKSCAHPSKRRQLTSEQVSDTIGISLNTHESGVRSVSTFKQLREEAGLTVQALASEAGVSLSTVNRMEYGTAQITRRIAYQVLNVISSKIGRRITIEEVEGLQVKS